MWKRMNATLLHSLQGYWLCSDWFIVALFFRVYNLLVADIMKTNLYYISFHSKYADLKALLEKSDLRSYPLVDSEGRIYLF